MNEITVFQNEEFGSVRTTTIDDEVWFVGKDVAEALKYENPQKALRDHVDDEDRIMGERNATPSIKDSLGRTQYPTFINESGVYSLVFGSKLESAKRFKHWVTHDVLPSIRRTGGYRIPNTPGEQIKLLAQGFTELDGKIETVSKGLQSVNKDLQSFKQEMPLLAIECQRITEAKNKKVVPLMGGKEANAYKNASLRGKVYRDLETQLRREFNVTSYKAIRRNQTDKAVEIINRYELPYYLAEMIDDENAQMEIAV